MVTAPWTSTHNTPNKSPRMDVARRGVVLHHAAMTSLPALHRLAMGAKQVSATALCKDNLLEHLIPDDRFRAWSLSSAWGDSAFRSVETCNQSTTGWTVSQTSHRSLAHAVAYWSEREGWWPHRDGPRNTWTVLGHREMYTIHGVSYATACPGGMDLDLVTRWAQDIRRGSSTAATEKIEILLEQDATMKIFLHRVGPDMAYYAASDTQLIGPLVMSAPRLAGVLALYGPAATITGEGIDGISDVIEANVSANKREAVADFEVPYSESFRPPASTILRSLDGKIDKLAAGGVDLDALAAAIVAKLPEARGGASIEQVKAALDTLTITTA